VKLRSLFPLAATFGMWASGGAMAATPAVNGNPNQNLANQVAERLNASGVSDLAEVSIVCEDGTVTLTGSAQNAAAKEKVLHEVRFTPGVTLVRDGVVIAAKAAMKSVPTQEVVVAQGGQPPMAPVAPTPVPMGMMGGPGIEPMPMGAPGMHTPDMQAPPLPPYAWPTYAPYNNVSRVAYPQSYPYNAFPFIGPYYPFPKVPLGSRKVILEWEDGHWFLGRASTPHDYWRVRFW
jgi:hypothetical protein